MESSGTLQFERRAAKRFTVPLRVEVWSHGQERGNAPKLEIRDFSQRGFYFFSELKRDPGSHFDFAVLFRKLSSEQEADLLRGRAQIVRCEDLGSTRTGHFGIAAKIEDTIFEVGDEMAGLEH